MQQKSIPFIFTFFFIVFLFAFHIALAQWQTKGPYPANNFSGASIRALCTNGKSLYAATSAYGIFLSTDNGLSWKAMNKGLTINRGLNVVGIYSLIANGANLVAGTIGHGIFFSTDSGASWSPGDTSLSKLSVLALVVKGSDIFAGTSAGVYLSTDNGSTWIRRNKGLINPGIYSLAVKASILYAGTYKGVCVSRDNGQNWTLSNNGLTNYVNAFTVDKSNLYAGTNGGGMFVSLNNGNDWVSINNGLKNNYVLSTAVNNGKVYAGTESGGVFLSTNEGKSWRPMNKGLTNTMVYSIGIHGANLFAGTDEGVFLYNIISSINIKKTDAICTGSLTGSATAIPVGGVPPYSYLWNTNPIQTTATATRVADGDSVKVTDANGASMQYRIYILTKAAPLSNFTITKSSLFSVNTVSKNTEYYWDYGDNSYSSGANTQHVYSAPGTYQVTLKAMDSTLVYCQSSHSQFITIGAGGCTIIADFSVNQDTTAKIVNFKNKSTGNNLKYYWDFGNGTSSSIQSPAGYRYPIGGAYTVCLTIRDSVQKCHNSACHDLIANNTADCSTKFHYFTDGTSAKVQFDGKSPNTANSYYWTFGNGDFSNDATPAYTYPVKGFYNVCLTTRDSIIPGCQSKHCEFVRAGNGGCKAKFSSLPDTSMNVNFSDQSVGKATAWYWDFGDGHISHLQNPNYKYSASGFYPVCLSVNANDCQDTWCSTVHVGNTDCKTSFSYFIDPVTITTGFKDISISSPTAWSWEFGDGTTSTIQNPLHIYKNAGNYTSCLTTQNAAGCISHSCEDLTVGASTNCQAGFDVFEQNNIATFKNTSKGTATTWFWDFGDEGYSKLQSPTHTYSTDGYYTVTLTMYNATGSCFNTFYKNVTIGVAAATKDCAAKFSYIANTTSNSVAFKDESLGNPVSWTWHFPDSTTSNLKNPVHTFRKPGFYQVCLTIVSSNGTSNVYCTEVGIGQTGLGVDFIYKENNKYFFKKDANYPITFYGSQYGKPNKWMWDFGDNTTDSLRINVTHDYLNAGSFNACLTVSDPVARLSSNFCKIVKVGSVQGIKENSAITVDLTVFPNPIVSQGTITYFIQQSAPVQLSLIDLQGKKIKTFVNDFQNGLINQIVDFTDMHLSDGMYFIDLNVNGKSFMKPVILKK